MAPLRDSAFCWTHDPARAADRAEARRRGGKAHGYPPAEVAPVTFTDAHTIRAELERLYAEAKAGQVPPERTRTLNALLGRAVELLNITEFEARLLALESRLNGNPSGTERIAA
jgi:hypothetical protein